MMSILILLGKGLLYLVLLALGMLIVWFVWSNLDDGRPPPNPGP